MRRLEQIYVCRATGTKFLQRDAFREHLVIRRKRQTAERRQGRVLAEIDQFMLGVETIAALETWLASGIVTRYLLERGAAKPPTVRSVQFAVKPHPLCSNTHSAPRGGVTNWRSELDKPKGYPGLEGRVTYTMQGQGGYFDTGSVSDALADMGICTGTGGSTDGKRYAYGCTIWAAHAPRLYAAENTQGDK